MDYETLQIIKNNLPRGAMARIARIAKADVNTVKRVFDGKSYNEKIIMAITKVADQWKQKQEFYTTALHKPINHI